jgi:hypothetical protein
MGELTKQQEQAAAIAAAVSKKAFTTAQRLPEESERLEAFADQAEAYLRSIDAMHIPREHPMVAHLVRQSEGNVTRWENYTTPDPRPHERPKPPTAPPRNCPMPDCAYFGPRGTCPTHDQST